MKEHAHQTSRLKKISNLFRGNNFSELNLYYNKRRKTMRDSFRTKSTEKRVKGSGWCKESGIFMLILSLICLPFSVKAGISIKENKENVILISSSNKFIISLTPRISWKSNILKVNDYSLTYVFRDKRSDYDSWLFPAGKDCKVEILEKNEYIIRVKITYEYVALGTKYSTLSDNYSISITAEIKKDSPFIFINATNSKKKGNFAYEGGWLVSGTEFSKYTLNDTLGKKVPDGVNWMNLKGDVAFFIAGSNEMGLGLISKDMAFKPTPKLFFSWKGSQWASVNKPEISMDFAIGSFKASESEKIFIESEMLKKTEKKAEKREKHFCVKTDKPM